MKRWNLCLVLSLALVVWGTGCGGPVDPLGGDPGAAGSGGGGAAGGGAGGGAASGGGSTWCGGILAQTTFTFGLCVCGDMNMAGGLYTDGFSGSGKAAPDELAGSAGVNGTFRNYGDTDIGGSLFTGADFHPIGNHDIRGELHVGGEAEIAGGDIHIFQDAYVTGSILGIRYVIDGVLHIPAASSVGLAVEAADVVREPVRVVPPCRCDQDREVDIAGRVAEAARDNDNGRIGLTPEALVGVVHPVDLELPPGRYYLDRLTAFAPVEIRVTGPTALFIEGDLKSASIVEIVLAENAPDAALDIFVAGSILATGVFELGTRDRPAQVRAYVAGAEDVRLAGDLDLGLNLYAPNARVVAAGPLDIWGSLTCRELLDAGVVRVHYDTDVLDAGDDCDPGPLDPVEGCTGCEDCGNQACIDGECTSCTDSAQCCAPLMCVNGTCVPPEV